ncbi:MAG: AbrB/MazE/SpoVT family DNA-binding domain-containing protein [Bacteroidetes bacterium]|nr:MAG: AbrB/MazE/SpoVT family DNA-binding domain-containing protein [Bacteroidota bacterium]
MDFETIDIKNKNGFQAIKIPEKLKINDSKVYLKKTGNSLYIIPFHNPWQNLIESLDTFTTDFMTNREQPNNHIRESFD